jgi:hypothetical protein
MDMYKTQGETVFLRSLLLDGVGTYLETTFVLLFRPL